MRWPLVALLLALAPVAAPAATPARFDALVEQARAAMLTDPHAAARVAADGERAAAALPPAARARALATALWLQGEARYRYDDYAGAAPLIERARAAARMGAPGSKLEGDILLTSGSLHGLRTEVAAALADFQRAHRIFRRVGDARGQAISLICLSTLYKDAKDYDAALKYLREALESYRADPKLAITIYNNRGVILQSAGRFSEAAVEFENASILAGPLKSPAIRLQLLRNQARNSLAEGNLAGADQRIASARALASRTDGPDPILLAIAARAMQQHGRVSEAARLIDRAFVNVDLSSTPLLMREAHETAFQIFHAMRREDKALAHLAALKRLDDEATKLATETSSALLAARFDSANQDAKIARLRDAERLRVARDALQRAKNERTLFLLGGGAAAVIMLLLGIGLVTLRRSRDRVRAANDGLAITNAALGKALAAKTEFLATTSHEIRTPLNGILGMTQVMLADAALAGPTRDRLTVVHGAGLSMRALVDDILDVAKMETGNLGLEVAPFDLRACLTDATRIWDAQARDKGLTFAVDLDRCPARVEGDAQRVRQIVFNLLSNAVKFTATGSVRLVANLADDGRIRLAVSDSGIGIAPEKQAEIFESFRQADTSTTRRFGGTGLGLAICRNLVIAMEGAISVDSVPEGGATFTITLPLPVLAAETIAPAVADRPALLVIERNPIARAMFRTLFAAHAPVVFADTADDAIAALTAGGVGQVLVDEAPARASGDAPAFIAAVVAAAGTVPVALLWPATAPAEERAMLVAGGRVRLLAKPIGGAALAAALLGRESGECAPPALVSRAA